MVGLTLLEIREHVDALATEAGQYVVVCARTGQRPIPVAGRCFPDRATARAAARAAEQYRTALRRYDPQVPFYDLIACEAPAQLADPDGTPGPGTGCDWSLSQPVVASSGSPTRDRDRVEFCHRVAAAVFETLSDLGHDEVESAIMDAYFELAERLADPDDLCLCLLESMARELDERLPPDEQATLLECAGTRMASPGATDDPIEETFDRLRRVGLVGSYACSPGAISRRDGPRTVVVRLSAYALSPIGDGLPVLPVVLDISRRRLDLSLSAVRAVDDGEGWRLIVAFGDDIAPGKLVTAPIRSA